MTFSWTDKNTVRLSSGREVYANQGIFGLTEDCALTDGYDSGCVDIQFGCDGEEKLTAGERKEIADMMIARWQRFSSGVDPKR
jgi:hypothetical protein